VTGCPGISEHHPTRPPAVHPFPGSQPQPSRGTAAAHFSPVGTSEVSSNPLIEAAEVLETKALALRQLSVKGFRANGDESVSDAYNTILAVVPAGEYFKIHVEISSVSGAPRVQYGVCLPTCLGTAGWYHGGTMGDALRAALSALAVPRADPVAVADVALARD
jgi:hypothetical protein